MKNLANSGRPHRISWGKEVGQHGSRYIYLCRICETSNIMGFFLTICLFTNKIKCKRLNDELLIGLSTLLLLKCWGCFTEDMFGKTLRDCTDRTADVTHLSIPYKSA